jgi:hypothetical protein
VLNTHVTTQRIPPPDAVQADRVIAAGPVEPVCSCLQTQRDEGYDPDDPDLVAAIDLVPWELEHLAHGLARLTVTTARRLAGCATY